MQKQIQWAASNKRALDELEKKLKRTGRADVLMNTAHHEAFESTDCLQCANCCRTTGPLLLAADVSRLAKATRLSETAFISKYTRTDEDGDVVFSSMPCPFLEADNRCRHYDDRPRACRRYPHTDESAQLSIFKLTKKNARICPAVSLMLRRLLEKLPT